MAIEDQILAAAAKATPRPWVRDGANCMPWELSPASFEWAGRRVVVHPTKKGETQMDCIADAEYIELAVNHADRIAARLKCAELEIEKAKRRITEVLGLCDATAEWETIIGAIAGRIVEAELPMPEPPVVQGKVEVVK